MNVSAKGRDGLGWYIIEIDDDGSRSLLYWNRYNWREAAEAEAQRKFSNMNTTVMFWDGGEWSDDK